jgi:signal transduction histidine kinase
LQQAFHSLIANALEAMPDRGTLTITCRVTEDQRRVLIQMSDTGQGIPKEHIDHVFKPFFTTKPKGLGIGLTLAKRIVEHHGGTITLTSCEGQGTTMAVSIPRAE